MTQPVSANGADGSAPCKTIEVHNKYIVVYQQSKVPFNVSRPARARFSDRMPDWEERCLRNAAPHVHETFPTTTTM